MRELSVSKRGVTVLNSPTIPSFFAAGEVTGNDGMSQCAWQCRQRFGAGRGRELRFDAIEFAVGFYNLRDVRPFALQQKENAGEAIEQFAGEDAGRLFAGMQVFV